MRRYKNLKQGSLFSFWLGLSRTSTPVENPMIYPCQLSVRMVSKPRVNVFKSIKLKFLHHSLA